MSGLIEFGSHTYDLHNLQDGGDGGYRKGGPNGIQRLAGETFRVLSCHGVSRVDVIVDRATGKIYVNEINTIPGSLSFYLWEASGLSFPGLMDRLVALAVKRKNSQDRKTTSFSQNIFALGGGSKGGVKGGLKGVKA